MWTRLLAVGMLAYALPSHAQITTCINKGGEIKVVPVDALCATGSTKTQLLSSNLQPLPTPTDVYAKGDLDVYARLGTGTPLVKLFLNPGNYVVWASIGPTDIVDDTYATELACRLFADGVYTGIPSATIGKGGAYSPSPPGHFNSVAMLTTFGVIVPTFIEVYCDLPGSSGAGNVHMGELELVAEAVIALHYQ